MKKLIVLIMFISMYVSFSKVLEVEGIQEIIQDGNNYYLVLDVPKDFEDISKVTLKNRDTGESKEMYFSKLCNNKIKISFENVEEYCNLLFKVTVQNKQNHTLSSSNFIKFKLNNSEEPSVKILSNKVVEKVLISLEDFKLIANDSNQKIYEINSGTKVINSDDIMRQHIYTILNEESNEIFIYLIL